MGSLWWYFLMTTFVLVPLTCWLKNWIPHFSKKLANSWAYAPSVTGLLILIGMAYLLWNKITGQLGYDKGKTALVQATEVYLIQLWLELFTLGWQYFFCFACCPCCMSARKDIRTFNDMQEDLLMKSDPNA